MLSVLIPVYNVNVHPLVSELGPQLLACGEDFEILIEDDASSDESVRHHNSLLDEMDHITYIGHTENLGRSKTRNLLAERAKFPYLLFIDCDARVKRKNYIADYLNYIREKQTEGQPFAVSGGLSYRVIIPKRGQRLRYKYGLYREVRPAAIRNRHPFQNFTPFNLLISKSVFETCRFDESLTNYGYEDTFFGLDLEAQGVPVRHIDNELYHDGLDDNRDFLRKTTDSVQNLYKLYQSGRVDDRFREQSRLLQTWERLHAKRNGKIIFKTLHLLKNPISNLVLRHNSLKALDLYKLVLFDGLQCGQGE